MTPIESQGFRLLLPHIYPLQELLHLLVDGPQPKEEAGGATGSPEELLHLLDLLLLLVQLGLDGLTLQAGSTSGARVCVNGCYKISPSHLLPLFSSSEASVSIPMPRPPPSPPPQDVVLGAGHCGGRLHPEWHSVTVHVSPVDRRRRLQMSQQVHTITS